MEGPILLKESTITLSTEHPNAKKKKIAFKISAPQESGIPGIYYFSVKEEEYCKEWMGAITLNSQKDVIDITIKSKQSTSMRLKKGVSSAIATSSAGKDIIRKFVGKKSIRSIDIVKEIIFKFSGDKKKSQWYRKCYHQIGYKNDLTLAK